MATWIITFTGRKKNALGIFYEITAAREGVTKEDALLALYNEYDHVMFPRFTLVEEPPCKR